MRVWIDGASPACAGSFFGQSLVERHLKVLARLRPRPAEVVVSGGVGPLSIVAGLGSRRIEETGAVGVRLERYLTAASQPVLVIDGVDLVDARLIELFARRSTSLVAFGGGEVERSALVRLEPAEFAALTGEEASVRALAEALLARGRASRLDPAEFPSFVANLRRELPWYVLRLANRAALAEGERFLFRANYKGSTDFLTKWVYPPIVWRLVRWMSRHRVHPTWVTLLGVALALAAVPFFAAGDFAVGLIMAYAMSILDSVDGKLARLTLTDSKFGNLLDHGLDIVHPPLWYLAWAWALGGADPASPVFRAGLWLIGFYVAYRLVLMIAKATFKRGLHGMTRLDAAVRTIIARRNVNLAVLTLGLIAGAAVPAFTLIVAWQGLTFAWHAGRTAWLIARRTPRAA